MWFDEIHQRFPPIVGALGQVLRQGPEQSVRQENESVGIAPGSAIPGVKTPFFGPCFILLSIKGLVLVQCADTAVKAYLEWV